MRVRTCVCVCVCACMHACVSDAQNGLQVFLLFVRSSKTKPVNYPISPLPRIKLSPTM